MAGYTMNEADKLLDFAMKSKGIKGENMGERLKNSQKYFERNHYQDLWNAHKHRNQLAHELGIETTKTEVMKHFNAIKRACRKLI